MSSLNSSSTLAQVQASYDDNASYAEDNDAAKARAFLTACRFLLRRMPAETGTTLAHTKLNPDLIQGEMDRCEKWVETHATSTGSGSNTSAGSEPRVTRGSFNSFRD